MRFFRFGHRTSKTPEEAIFFKLFGCYIKGTLIESVCDLHWMSSINIGLHEICAVFISLTASKQ